MRLISSPWLEITNPRRRCCGGDTAASVALTVTVAMIRVMKQVSLSGRKIALLAVLAIACTGIAANARSVAGTLAQVILGGQQFSVEIADSAEAQHRGLMYRESLAADRGMLFVYPDAALRSFWMKNTRIPLDILYFDTDYRLVSVIHSAPPCLDDPCPDYPSQRPTRYVLELNGGTAIRLGVRLGDRLTRLP